MLLNYTPQIAIYLIGIGIIGSIIGLMFFITSAKYTLPIRSMTVLFLSIALMFVGIFIKEYKSRDANFADIPDSITVSGDMVTISNLPASYTLEPEDINGRASNTYRFEYNHEFGKYTLTTIEGRIFELSDENADYIKSRQKG